MKIRSLFSKLFSNSKIVVNEKEYTGTMIEVYIDGIKVGTFNSSVHITVHGDAVNIETSSGDVRIVGDVDGSVKTSSGDITCGFIKMGATTSSGDIEVNGDISGSVSTSSGGVSANSIYGSIKTDSGDIIRK